MAVANGLWGVSEGGGENAGVKECIFTVQSVEPGAVKTNAAKKNLLFKGVNEFGKPMQKTFGIGTDWNFDFVQAKYIDAKGNADRQVNANTTFGIFLASIVGKSKPTLEGGPLIDLSEAMNDLRQFPMGPLSPIPWVGTRWHMLEVSISFGSSKQKQQDGTEVEKEIINKMLFPIRYLGREGTPLPSVNWFFGQPKPPTAPAAPQYGGYQQYAPQAPAPAQASQAPAPQGYAPQAPQTPQYAPQVPQGYQQAPAPQGPPQGYAQPQGQPQYAQYVQVAPQAPQAPAPQYQPQAPQAPQAQYHQEQVNPQYAPQAPQGYQQAQQPQYAPQAPVYGGGPSAAPGFPG